MAAVLDTRLHQAQTEKLSPIGLVSALVADELQRRQDRLLDRRHKLARFRDPQSSLDTFDFDFNKKMNRALIYELATAGFIARREDGLFLGPPGTGKSHLVQAPRAIRRSRTLSCDEPMHLREILTRWITHYNRGRPHSSLGPGLPDPRPDRMVASNGHQLPDGYRVVAMPILGGLHHEYRVEAAA